MNARRLALLGLNAPLSPIMLAVLGIWPDAGIDPPLPGLDGLSITSGGPDASDNAAQYERDIEEDLERERDRAFEELTRRRRSAAYMALTAIALAEIA